MLEIVGAGELVVRIARLHVRQDNDEGLRPGIDRCQIEADFPYRDIPEPVQIEKVTPAQKFRKADEIRPQGVVHVDTPVAADHPGEVCREIRRAGRDTDKQVKGIEPGFEKGVQKPRGEYSPQRASLDNQGRF